RRFWLRETYRFPRAVSLLEGGRSKQCPGVSGSALSPDLYPRVATFRSRSIQVIHQLVLSELFLRLLLGHDVSLIQFNQRSLDKFQSQNFMNFKGIVSLSAAMSFENLFQRTGTKVRSTTRIRVEKHLP